MGAFSFLEVFQEEDARWFRETWERVQSTVSKPHSVEAHSNLISIFNGMTYRLFNCGARFAREGGERVRFVDLSAEYRRGMVRELLAEIPREKQLKFNLPELLGRIYRQIYDSKSWSASPVELTDNRLTIDGHQVMDAWETPIMHGMVDSCLELCDRERPPRVLELGWGMGIAGKRFIEHNVDYTVVEAHARIAENARRYLTDKGRVVQCLWQDIRFEPESFDIVFFDVYYATYAPLCDYFLEVVRFFHPLLSSGGVFTYFLGNSPDQIPKLLENGFTKVVCRQISGFEIPPDCSYSRPGRKYWLNVLAVK